MPVFDGARGPICYRLWAGSATPSSSSISTPVVCPRTRCDSGTSSFGPGPGSNADLPSIRVGAPAMYGDLDRVSPVDGVRSWLRRAPGLELREIAGARHDVLDETGHRRTTAVIADFVLERAEAALLESTEGEAAWRD